MVPILCFHHLYLLLLATILVPTPCCYFSIISISSFPEVRSDWSVDDGTVLPQYLTLTLPHIDQGPAAKISKIARIHLSGWKRIDRNPSRKLPQILPSDTGACSSHGYPAARWRHHITGPGRTQSSSNTQDQSSDSSLCAIRWREKCPWELNFHRFIRIWVILRCWGNSSILCQQNSDALLDALKCFPDSPNYS